MNDKICDEKFLQISKNNSIIENMHYKRKEQNNENVFQ